MELTQEIVTNDMHKIKEHLGRLGLTDVSVEYPGFLSIVFGEREYHAGYSYDYDEKSDGEMFQLYDFTDGYNHPFSVTFETNQDTQYIAGKLRRLILSYMNGGN